MPSRIALGLIALAASLAAGSARADGSVVIEGFAGWQSLRPSANGLANAASGREGTAILGADILGRMDVFGLGVSIDKTTSGSNGQPWAGEDMFNSTGKTFLGFRPGVSVRLVPAPIRIGVSVPIRWNTSGGSFSSPDYGFVGRVGFEFP